MSTCGKCGAQIKENVKFCKACGSKSFDDKKSRVLAQERTWLKPAVVLIAVFVVIIAGWMFKGSRGTNMSDAAQFAPNHDITERHAKFSSVTHENGEVRIPVNVVDDGKAHFFSYSGSGKAIHFFALRAADGSIRTALDACMACNHAKLGYRQEGGMVVCNNCGMAFKPTDIGIMRGGCSPIAVNKSVDGQMIVLKTKDLEAGQQYF